MSQLHDMKTRGAPLKERTVYEKSPRAGTHTKTRAKTAKACGSNYTPVLGWRARKVGESGKAYGKRVKTGILDNIKAARRGDKGGMNPL